MLIRKWRERRERRRVTSKKMALINCVCKMADLRTKAETAKDPGTAMSFNAALIAETYRYTQIKSTPASCFKPDGSGRYDGKRAAKLEKKGKLK